MHTQQPGAMGPGPLIILCPLRSYSSVVCAMLGQHPGALGMPELNLFLAPQVAAVMARLRARMPAHGSDGLLRALAQLHDGVQNDATVAAARSWLAERGEWPVHRLLRHLRESVAPKMLIDKSPSTVMRPEFMARAGRILPDARFLHLTRNPISYGESLMGFVKRSGDWGRQIDPARINPEALWLRAQQFILGFTGRQAPERCLRVRGEDILRNPREELAAIADWLGLDTGPESIAAMLHPECSPFACVGPESASGGNDPNFLERPALDEKRLATMSVPALAAELPWSPGTNLAPETVLVARQLGYV